MDERLWDNVESDDDHIKYLLTVDGKAERAEAGVVGQGTLP